MLRPGQARVWVDAMNPRPRVWPSVGRLLSREFPQLHDEYGRILHHEPTRRAYVEDMRERVRTAACRAGIEDRLSG